MRAMGDGMCMAEYVKCMKDVAYFVSRYIHIYNATAQRWLLLEPWPAQGEVLQIMQRERLLIILKARQLGLSWLACAYALWLLTFRPPATVLLFSQRAAEAEELLARIRQMYGYLPTWLQAPAIQRDKDQAFELSSGSRALAFSTRGGRSYTGTLAIIDEADHVPDLAAFLNAVKPTVDAGGKLFLISTADKSRPVSTFKNLFRTASTQHKGYSPQRHQDTKNSGGLLTDSDLHPE